MIRLRMRGSQPPSFVDQWQSFTRMAAGAKETFSRSTDFASTFTSESQGNFLRGHSRRFRSPRGAVGQRRIRLATSLQKKCSNRWSVGSAYRDHLRPALENPTLRPALSYILAWLLVGRLEFRAPARVCSTLP